LFNAEFKKQYKILSEISREKEIDLKEKIDDIQGELFELKAYYESYVQRIEEEKEAVVRETQSVFMDELEPIRSKYASNALQIETQKEEIRKLKESFQGLRAYIIQNAKLTEKKAVQESKIETAIEAGKIIDKLRICSEESEQLKEKVEKGTLLCNHMKNKLNKSKIQLNQACLVLKSSKTEMGKLIEGQTKEIDMLRAKKMDMEHQIMNSIEEIEQFKEIIGENLDKMDYEYDDLEKRNQAFVSLMDENFEKSQKVLAHMQDRVDEVQEQCKSLQDRNKQIIMKLNQGLKQVIKSNLK